MKKIFFAITAVLAVQFQIMAQNDTIVSTEEVEIVEQDTTLTDTLGNETTTRIDLKNTYITIHKKDEGEVQDEEDEEKDKYSDRDRKKDLTWWNGIDLGVNGIMNSEYGFDLGEDMEYLEPDYAKSRYISFNLLEVKGRIIKDYVGITSGIGFQIYSFKYSHNNTFTFNDTLSFFQDSTISLSKNKLRVSYLAVPVMLEFNTSRDPEKSFHISAGVVGKLRIGNMYKQKFTMDGQDHKEKMKGDLLFNSVAADAIVRVGYHNFTLFAQVGLTPLFESDAAPDTRTFAGGIAINLF